MQFNANMTPAEADDRKPAPEKSWTFFLPPMENGILGIGTANGSDEELQ